MHCDEVRPLMDAYLDGELDLDRSLQIERHLQACASCAPAMQIARRLRSAIKEDIPYFRAPRSLEQRVRAIARNEARTEPRSGILSWQWLVVAAAMVLIVLGAVSLERIGFGPSHQDLIAQEIVDGHIRSLMANHLSDVVSTDQHTVKPWFDGKLDFAPPVVNLVQADFPLVGGRLDYIDGRPVAALVYQRRLHYINLFIWPSAGKPSSPLASQAREGYTLLHWTRDDMTFWAISDLSMEELQTFAALFQK